jgi:hypothetical protein
MRIVEANSQEVAMSPFEAGSVTRRRLLGGACATAVLLTAPSIAAAQEHSVVKIGLIQSMTGPLNTIGKAVVDGARLYSSMATPWRVARFSSSSRTTPRRRRSPSDWPKT